MKSRDLSDLNKVWEIKTLKLSRQDECHAILERIAKQVEPILKRRQWKIRLLCEFQPKDRGLLGMNVNRGQKVLIRMRPAHNPNSFYPYEHLLGTMLHEMAHMEIGPHNAAFQKLWDDLWDEVEQLMDDSFQRAKIPEPTPSFSGVGHRLGGARPAARGGGAPPSLPPREAARRAAEQRARVQQLMNPGGSRLGGGSVSQHQALRRRLRAAARARGEGACGGLVVAGARGGEGPAAAAAVPWVCSRCTFANNSQEGEGKCCAMCGAPFAVAGLVAIDWGCPECTLLNKGTAIECDICGHPRSTEETVRADGKDYKPFENSGAMQEAIPNGPGANPNAQAGKSAPPAAAAAAAAAAPGQREEQEGAGANWACDQCTFLNFSALPACEVCGGARPPPPPPPAAAAAPPAAPAGARGGEGKVASGNGPRGAGGGGGGWACPACTFLNGCRGPADAGVAQVCVCCGLEPGQEILLLGGPDGDTCSKNLSSDFDNCRPISSRIRTSNKRPSVVIESTLGEKLNNNQPKCTGETIVPGSHKKKKPSGTKTVDNNAVSPESTQNHCPFSPNITVDDSCCEPGNKVNLIDLCTP